MKVYRNVFTSEYFVLVSEVLRERDRENGTHVCTFEYGSAVSLFVEFVIVSFVCVLSCFYLVV